MCKYGHSDKFRSSRTNQCLICRADATRRCRHKLGKLAKYKLNVSVFKQHIPKGKTLVTLELCGVSRDTIGHLYRGDFAPMRKYRMRLAEALKLSHDVLWEQKQ